MLLNVVARTALLVLGNRDSAAREGGSAKCAFYPDLFVVGTQAALPALSPPLTLLAHTAHPPSRKETKRTEELEENRYRSPTWAVLRALQQINNATRIAREAVMSAPPFFQSAGRGDLLFWGGKERPTVIKWESLSEQGKKSWLEESSTMHDWVMWSKSKKRAEGNLLI